VDRDDAQVPGVMMACDLTRTMRVRMVMPGLVPMGARLMREVEMRRPQHIQVCRGQRLKRHEQRE
jgi:hypothetical protein